MKTVCKKLFSLMLVAILLVSAIPFAASAATGDPCTLKVCWYDGTTYIGQNGGNRVVGDSFDIDSYVKSQYDPGYAYTITSRTQNGTAVGSSITYVDGENMIAVYTAKTNAVLTLDAGTNGGTISGNSSATRDVTYNVAVGDLPQAVKANNTFLGWFENADGTGHQLQSNEAWLVNGNKTYYACFRENRNALTISAIKMVDGVQKESYTLFNDSVMENQLLLAYLTTNWNDDVRAAVPTGYKWEPEQWYNNAASTPLSDQTQFNDANRAVFVKFTAKSYTLTFDPGVGGKVNPTSKTVYYDKAVGELPTPSCDGKVFSHWVDQNGNTVTANTIYKYDGNHKLTAVYQGEIIVNLHMHTEKSKTGGIIAPLSGYVAGDDITQTIAMNVVKNYYSGNMTFVGLFNTSDWNQYVDGKLPTGKNFVEIPDGVTSYTIHVMINNGTLGNGGSSNSGSTSGSNSGSTSTKPADKTNPATGDGIFAVMSVMMGSGAAVLSLNELRKRNKI